MPTFVGIDYNFWWFLVFGAIISGYAILDGFDLGSGCLHLMLQTTDSRRKAMHAIGPIWDGNEVWLVIGGGALFAGFPVAYAAIFSAFYIPLMIFLVGLIFRGIAIEFRDQESGERWGRRWDAVYCISSLIISLSLGLVLGNVVEGIPLNEEHEFAGSWFTFFNPFAILVAITTTALFMLHGAIYLLMKTEEQLFRKLNKFANSFTIFFIVFFFLTTVYTLIYLPYLNTSLHNHPSWFVVPLLAILSIANVPRRIKTGKYRRAFASSTATIALLLITVAIDVFPNLVYSRGLPENSINIHNGASSIRSLRILLIIAMIGIPLVGTYTAFVFWTFKGKVHIDQNHE
ncbi:MAG TPA: cytochrome d ubiquinol oxidase subunit II [Puia sp.]|jgi:cytochrome d ubiquinol oxidase subunit II|nr:cytochrome d ubiquinol oxidase subunit II [Puia sp.]